MANCRGCGVALALIPDGEGAFYVDAVKHSESDCLFSKLSSSGKRVMDLEKMIDEHWTGAVRALRAQLDDADAVARQETERAKELSSRLDSVTKENELLSDMNRTLFAEATATREAFEARLDTVRTVLAEVEKRGYIDESSIELDDPDSDLYKMREAVK